MSQSSGSTGCSFSLGIQSGANNDYKDKGNEEKKWKKSPKYECQSGDTRMLSIKCCCVSRIKEVMGSKNVLFPHSHSPSDPALPSSQAPRENQNREWNPGNTHKRSSSPYHPQ